MPARSAVSRLRGARVGIVVGTAIALVGLGVGGAMATSTTNPYVFVANPSSSPVPISGPVSITNPGTSPVPVSVTNQSSAQTVTGSVAITNPDTSPVPVAVGNFPATQQVSGSVSVTNLPGSQVADTALVESATLKAGDTGLYDFAGTPNVTMIDLVTGDTMRLEAVLRVANINTVATLHDGDGTYREDFTLAVPMSQVSIACENGSSDCHFDLTVIGQ